MGTLLIIVGLVLALVVAIFGKKKRTATPSAPAQPTQPVAPIEPTPEFPPVNLKAVHLANSTNGMSYEQCLLYFKDVLTTEFPDYTFCENVAVQDLVGPQGASFKLYDTRPVQEYKPEWGLPYSFVAYKGTRVVAAILVVRTKKDYKKVKLLVSKAFMDKLNIPLMVFYADIPNRIEYVVTRVAKTLK